MVRVAMASLAEAKRRASAGVDYSSRFGALCPWCGQKTKITRTTPWEENVRIIYHRCENRCCVLTVMNISIKSIEID